MACLKLKNCCFCLNLRRGTIVIAIVTLVFEVTSLVIHSILAKYLTDKYNGSKETKQGLGYVYAQQFLVFLFMVIVCFKLLLGTALLIGLFKRLPDHLEMWYKGYMLSMILQLAITVCAAIKAYEKVNVYYWLYISERTIVAVATFYFILVVRSYYFKMCKESNYYQNMIYNESTKGNDIFCDRSKNEEDIIYETIPSQKNATVSNMKPPEYGLFSKLGGEVYSAPNNNSLVGMPMPMPVPEATERQSSALYPSLV